MHLGVQGGLVVSANSWRKRRRRIREKERVLVIERGGSDENE